MWTSWTGPKSRLMKHTLIHTIVKYIPLSFMILLFLNRKLLEHMSCTILVWNCILNFLFENLIDCSILRSLSVVHIWIIYLNWADLANCCIVRCVHQLWTVFSKNNTSLCWSTWQRKIHGIHLHAMTDLWKFIMYSTHVLRTGIDWVDHFSWHSDIKIFSVFGVNLF